MAYDHQYGRPINILGLSDVEELSDELKEFNEICKIPEIQDHNVVILSLIGACRGGKSFFLDFCLMFLYAHFPSIKNPNKVAQSPFRNNDSWIKCPNESLKGFPWRSGSKRDTVGINIWSDVFLHTIESTGEKLAIFVMDTQGLFDKNSTPTDNSRIVNLATLISSIQVFNVKNLIYEDQLQYLQFATECAQFSLKAKMKMDGKPFQNMTFLVRDWNNCDEYDYGLEGGKGYLEEVLKIEPSPAPELQSVRESIKNCYDLIQCCLLPYPGKSVASGKNYDGRLSEMDEEFEEELKKTIEHLLHPDNLPTKKINLQTLRVKDLHVYILNTSKLFQSGKLPNIQTLYQFSVESQMRKLMENFIGVYKSRIYLDLAKLSLQSKESITNVHNRWKEDVLKLYDGEIKVCDKRQEQFFRNELENKINSAFKELSIVSEQKSNDLRKQSEQYKTRLYEEKRNKEIAKLSQAELKDYYAKIEKDLLKAKENLERLEKETEPIIKQKEEESLLQQESWRKEKRKEENNCYCSIVSNTGIVIQKQSSAGGFIDGPRVARGCR